MTPLSIDWIKYAIPIYKGWKNTQNFQQIRYKAAWEKNMSLQTGN